MIATRQEGGWLVLRAGVPAPEGGIVPWDLLRANAWIAGPAKTVLPGGLGPAEARAELRIEERERPDRLSRAIHSVRMAAAAAETPRAGGIIDEGPAEPVDWIALLDQIGWPGKEKGPERIVVPVEGIPGAQRFVIARSSGGGGGQWSVRLELGAPAGLGEVSREAIARMLLGATARLRRVRACAEPTGAVEALLYEVPLPAAAGAADLKDALAALAAAAASCGAREAAALGDGALAETFLRLRGGDPLVGAGRGPAVA